MRRLVVYFWTLFSFCIYFVTARARVYSHSRTPATPVTPRLTPRSFSRASMATPSDDFLTPFVENYADVFREHVLSRLIDAWSPCQCVDAHEDAVPGNFFSCLVLRAVSRAFRNVVPPYRALVEAEDENYGGAYPIGFVPTAELRRLRLIRSMRESPSLERYTRRLLSETARAFVKSPTTRAALKKIEESECSSTKCELCQRAKVGCIYCAKTCRCRTHVLCCQCDSLSPTGDPVVVRELNRGVNRLVCATCCNCESLFCPDCATGPTVTCRWCMALLCQECSADDGAREDGGTLCCDECGEYACEPCQKWHKDPRLKCHVCEFAMCDLCSPKPIVLCSACDRMVCVECLEDDKNFVECSMCQFRALKSCAFDAGFRRMDAEPNTILCSECIPVYRFECFEIERDD